jgi:hypothetical protein
MNKINICFIIILVIFFGLFVINIKENFDNHLEEEMSEETNNMVKETDQEISDEEINLNDIFEPEEYPTPKINTNVTELVNSNNEILEESNINNYQEEEHQHIEAENNIILPISFSLSLPIEMSTNINLNNVKDATIVLLTTAPINLSNQFIENITFRSGSIIIDVSLNIDSDETYDKLKNLEKENNLFLTINGMKFKVEVFKPAANIKEVDPRRPNLSDCPTETDPVCCLEPYNSNNYPYKTHKNMCIAKANGALENYCKIGKCDEKKNWESTIHSWKHNHTSHDHSHYYDWEKDLDKLTHVHNKTMKDGNTNIVQANLKGVSSIFAPRISISD